MRASHSTLNRLILFGLIGVLNTGVDWGIFWVIGEVFAIPAKLAWLAKGGSYSVGIIFSYILNSGITFKAESAGLRQAGSGHNRLFSRFFTVAILCMIINSAVYAMVRTDLYLDPAALVAATIASFLIGFYLNHVWTYNTKTKK